MLRLNLRCRQRPSLSSTPTTVPVRPAMVGVHRQLDGLALAPRRMQSGFMPPSGIDLRDDHAGSVARTPSHLIAPLNDEFARHLATRRTSGVVIAHRTGYWRSTAHILKDH